MADRLRKVSGDGKLPSLAATPQGSELVTTFLSLTIFTTSATLGANITVAENPSFLFGEAGSTVKHLAWRIPDCVSPGLYNFTLYETSRINGEVRGPWKSVS